MAETKPKLDPTKTQLNQIQIQTKPNQNPVVNNIFMLSR